MSVTLCPACKKGTLKVIDSRAVGDGEVCRRRYKCTCGVRFTTVEVQMGEITRDGHAHHGKSKDLLGELAAKRIVGDAYDPM